MRTWLEKAHDVSSIGTFVLTIAIVAFMVLPMLPNGSADTTAPRNEPVIGWLMPAVLAACVLVAGILNLLAAKARYTFANSSSSASSGTTPTIQAEERNFVGASITPEYLVGLFKEHTGIQARKLIEPFIGKWMRVSGHLSEVLSSTPNLAQVTFSGRGISSDLAVIYMYFRTKESFARLAILRRGDSLTIVGKICDVNPVQLDLDTCELEG
jgi:hypothetical protein